MPAGEAPPAAEEGVPRTEDRTEPRAGGPPRPQTPPRKVVARSSPGRSSSSDRSSGVRVRGSVSPRRPGSAVTVVSHV
eukprot:COSAG04_NODE_259_length_18733_cov_5.191371_1_plen_77_part_10